MIFARMDLSYVCLFLVSFLAICHGNDMISISQILLNKSSYEIGQCPLDGSLLRIANGYISNTANILITTRNRAYGYLEYICAPGYTLEPSIGSRLTCHTNGSWSALPVCKCKLIDSIYTYVLKLI